jgi:hypothetical protein
MKVIKIVLNFSLGNKKVLSKDPPSMCEEFIHN